MILPTFSILQSYFRPFISRCLRTVSRRLGIGWCHFPHWCHLIWKKQRVTRGLNGRRRRRGVTYAIFVKSCIITIRRRNHLMGSTFTLFPKESHVNSFIWCGSLENMISHGCAHPVSSHSMMKIRISMLTVHRYTKRTLNLEWGEEEGIQIIFESAMTRINSCELCSWMLVLHSSVAHVDSCLRSCVVV